VRKPPNLDIFYKEWYDNQFYGKGLIPFCMKRSHALLEKPFTSKDSFDKVLEVGAGVRVQHLAYVKHKFKTYIATDNNDDVIKSMKSNVLPENVQIQKSNAYPLKYPDNSFDRLIASHILEHINYPEKVLAEWSRVVKNGGVISIALPCDPALAWRLGRYFSTFRSTRKKGMGDYKMFIATEHVNTIFQLKTLISYYFPITKESYWPLRVKNPDLNLFYIIHITNNK